jgi:transposase-like protein
MSETKQGRRSRDEWKRLVSRYERSGASRREFCRREGLNENTFRLWWGRLRSESPSAPPSPTPFVEVVPAASVESRWTIELELPGGATFRLRG